MKTKQAFSKTVVAAFSAATFALPFAHVSGALLAYEGFISASGGNLNGQATLPSGDWFSAAQSETWTAGSAISGPNRNSGFDGQASGLSYTGLETSGGSASAFRIANTTSNTPIGANIASGDSVTNISQNELYFSVLINADNVGVGNTVSAGWDHRISGNRGIGFAVDGSGNLYYSTSANSIGVDTSLDLVSGVNLIVIRATHSTAPSPPNGGDEYQLWLNPTPGQPAPVADYSAAVGFAGLTPGNGSFGFGEFYMGIDLGDTISPTLQDVVFDELRLGETFSDVTPFFAIPEPSGFVLLSIGFLSLLLVRKLRR